jgi:hypothetical protein
VHSPFNSTFGEYPIPTTGSESAEITTGPDGSLWFVESGPGKIGRITTGGSFTEYDIPPSGPPGSISLPTDITAGPDGNIWCSVTNGVTGFLARIAPDGNLTEYAIPADGRTPRGLVAGPDGNLWIAESNDMIARLNLLSATAAPLTVSVGNTFAGPVATFSTFDTLAKPSDFTATVNWGDGSPASIASITGNAKTGFTVGATHTYNLVGSYAASVTITSSNAVPPQDVVTFQLPFKPSTATASFTTTVGPSTHLAFVQQPTSTFVGQPLSPAVTVAVEDTSDNIVFGDSSSIVTLSLGTNAGGGTLGGSLSAQVVHGVATFNNVSLSRPGNGYTLLAADGGLVGGQSAPFNITALDVAVGSDNLARLLWDNVDGAARFWSINNSLQTSNATDNGPFVGFTAQKIATGADGLTRVLWTRSDGLASLWVVNAANVVLTSSNFGPYPGYSAVDITVGNDNKTRILWDNVSGQASVWTVDSNYNVTNQVYFGPFTGFTAQALAAGTDGLTRLLWNTTSGVAALWLLNGSNALVGNQSFGAFTGLTAVDVTVGSDSKARLLWDNVNAQATIWTVDDNFAVTNQQSFGPYAGFIANGLAAGADGVTRLVWTALNGSVVLTLLNANNTLNNSISYQPWANGTLPDVAVPVPAAAPAAPVVPTAGSGASSAAVVTVAAAPSEALLLPLIVDTTTSPRPVARKKAVVEPHSSATQRAEHKPRHDTPRAASPGTGHHGHSKHQS